LFEKSRLLALAASSLSEELERMIEVDKSSKKTDQVVAETLQRDVRMARTQQIRNFSWLSRCHTVLITYLSDLNVLLAPLELVSRRGGLQNVHLWGSGLSIRPNCNGILTGFRLAFVYKNFIFLAST
jgi:hypothetical protein